MAVHHWKLRNVLSGGSQLGALSRPFILLMLWLMLQVVLIRVIHTTLHVTPTPICVQKMKKLCG